MTRLTIKLVAIFGIQGVVAWFFYRCRVISHESWTGSDLVVFALPLLVGFAVAAGVLFFSFPRKRIAATLGLSAAGAAVASFIGTVIAFNLYGT